jgi:hypothetical protein
MTACHIGHGFGPQAPCVPMGKGVECAPAHEQLAEVTVVYISPGLEPRRGSQTGASVSPVPAQQAKPAEHQFITCSGGLLEYQLAFQPHVVAFSKDLCTVKIGARPLCRRLRCVIGDR